MKENTGLSQEELVKELHRRGYVDVKPRQVIDWRFRGVLPAFDLQGPGGGRSSGRLRSQWSNPRTIVEHAVWIIELLNLYGSYRQVYVPLWLLGYPIEPHRILQALSEPLERTMASVERECSSDRNMEDVLSDAACSLTAKLKKEEFPVCDVTQDAMDLVLNVFMNPNYDLTDIDAFGALQTWLQHCERTRFGRGKPAATNPQAPSTIEEAIQQAVRFREHLSLPKIRQAVNECSDEEVRCVGGDLQRLRHVGRMVARLLSTELPADFALPWDMLWRLTFGLGRMLVCIDLSLRKHGFGNDIDALLSDVVARAQSAYEQKFASVDTESVFAA